MAVKNYRAYKIIKFLIKFVTHGIKIQICFLLESWLMLNEVRKYKATCIQIAGFSMMMPFGNLVVNYLNINKSQVEVVVYFILVFVLLVCGTITILKGIDILEGKL